LQQAYVERALVDEQSRGRYQSGPAKLLVVPVDRRIREKFGRKIVDPRRIEIDLRHVQASCLLGRDVAFLELHESVGVGLAQRDRIVGEESTPSEPLGNERLGRVAGLHERPGGSSTLSYFIEGDLKLPAIPFQMFATDFRSFRIDDRVFLKDPFQH
jgi:hypothetical protein